MIAAILISRFTARYITEICDMDGSDLDDFTNSVIYKEIFGLGFEEGLRRGRQAGLLKERQEGRQKAAASFTLRLLQRRCGPLSPELQTRIQALPLAELEDLAEALLDFQGFEDLMAWLDQLQG